MTKYTGKTVLSGIAIGKAYNYRISQNYVSKHHVFDTDAELLRLEEAFNAVKNSLKDTYIKASTETGESNASIFEVYQLILDDATIRESINESIIRYNINAEYAVTSAYKKYIKIIKDTNDSYQKERIEDIKDIYKQVISELNKNKIIKTELSTLANNIAFNEPVIVFADELTPSEIINIDKSGIAGFVINKGSITSHSIILLKSMGFPVIIGIKYHSSMENKMCIIDGDNSELFIGPDDDFISHYSRMKCEKELEQNELLEAVNKKILTKDGKHILLLANIVDNSELSKIEEYNADGVGLFRSEILYIKNEYFPSEEYLFNVFKNTAKALGSKKLVIRTLDIGLDKIPEFILKDASITYNNNIRGVEFCLRNPEIFKTELRAIIRASAYGNVSIMYPMVNSPETLTKIKEIVNEITSEFDKKGIKYGDFSQGAMIETKEAVINSELISREADFISIGSNDLADDLFNPNHDRKSLASLTEENYKELLDNIKTIISNGHIYNKKVEICGELASNLKYLNNMIDMDIDALSVIPDEILSIRKEILE